MPLWLSLQPNFRFMLDFLSKSIVYRFNAIILTIIIFGLSSFALLIGIYNYNRTIEELENKAQNTLAIAKTSLANPLWNVNRASMETVVLSLMLDTDVVAIQVHSEYEWEEPLIVSKREPIPEDGLTELEGKAGFRHHKGDIVYEQKHLVGKVHIVTSTRKALDLIKYTSLMIGVFTLILIIFMGMVVTWTAKKIIKRPIILLENNAEQLAKGNLEQTIDISRKDELGRLAKSFHHMRNAIHKKIQDLYTLNNAGETLSGLHNQTDAFNVTLKVMKEHIDAEGGSIYLLTDPQTLNKQASFFNDGYETSNAPQNLRFGEGIAGKAADQKKIIFIPDTSQAAERPEADGSSSPEAVLCIPMIHNQEVFGVMQFSGKPDKVHFEEEDEKFAVTVARLAIARTKNIDMLNVIEQQNEALEERIQELFRDPLTGCWNQRKLVQDLEAGQHTTLLYLKIDKFNEINDGLNFEAGNAVLRQVYQILDKHLPPESILYRLSGSEFGILLKNDEQFAAKLSDTIKEHINDARITYQNLRIVVTLSCGIADNQNESMFRSAHLALGESKKTGKTVIYTKDLSAKDEHLKNLQQFERVQEGFEKNAFFPVYQGIRDNRKGPGYGTIPKYECLMRLQTSDRDLSPFFFIRALERSGSISRATKVMIMKSFDHMSHNDYEFSINLTEKDLMDEGILEFINFQLEGNKIAPERVTFEVLEGISSSGYNQVTTMLEKLKAMGCKIAIDDFGAELSNIGRLLNFEPDYIKIDAKFIKDLPTDPKSRIIVENIYDLATRIGSEVVAEFVETQEIQDIIEEIGIHFSQGYLFSKPSKTTEEPETSN